MINRGVCAIIKLEKLDKLKATIKLLANLEQGEKSAGESGWISADDVESMFGL